MAYQHLQDARFNAAHKAYEVVQAVCYACDSKTCGVTWHLGRIVLACERHSNWSIRTKTICYMCDRVVAVNAGQIDDLGRHVHLACERRARES